MSAPLTSSIPARTRVVRARQRPGVRRGVLIGTEIAVPIVLVAVWWLVSAQSTNTFFPPLQTIVERLTEMISTAEFWSDVRVSLGNLFLSFAIACVAGIAVGTVLGLVRPLAWFAEPTLHFFRAIPPVALVPIFVSLLGFGNETRILSITLSTFFPVLIATLDGIAGMEPVLRMVNRVYRIGLSDRLVSVVLPAASPRILAGMQVGLITAFVVMIASEMLGSSVGLGAATLLAQQTFAIADMWAGIIVLGVIGYLTTALFTLFRRRVLRWYVASQMQERNA
ncbi:MAG: ABC transporter permease [Microbacterium sp.]